MTLIQESYKQREFEIKFFRVFFIINSLSNNGVQSEIYIKESKKRKITTKIN